jgi:hypothetical protein
VCLVGGLLDERGADYADFEICLDMVLKPRICANAREFLGVK